jgi:hypothetical protein
MFATAFGLIITLHAMSGTPAVAQSPAENHATVQMQSVPTRFHAGDTVKFKMTLNDPLPEGAYFNVRLSPTSVDQEIPVSSGAPTNRERTEFTLSVKLPDKVVPGEWRIKVVWLFLPGASWTSNTLATNPNFKFVVEGPKVDVPTQATATLVD